MPAAETIGLLYEQTEQPGAAVGRDVAVSQLVLALGLHGREYGYSLYCASRQVPDVATRFALEPGLAVAARRDLGRICRFRSPSCITRSATRTCSTMPFCACCWPSPIPTTR